jgi:alcohol dehydrogenase class IV
VRSAWSFYSAGQLVFGRGASAQLGHLVAQRKASKVFVVSDPRLVAAGIVERVVKPLTDAGIATRVFDQGEPEPSIAAAIRAADAAARFAPDCLLGLGGGSNMDLAKFAAILLTHGGPPSKYFSFNNVPGPILPLVCSPIPTITSR